MPEAKPLPKFNLQGEYCPLACLWEDAPQSALKGQFCHFATPLMTPFASIVPETWHHFYRQNLGKPGIDYWEWQNFPESRCVCPELSALLSLTPPTFQTKSILLSLAQKPLQQFSQGNFLQQTQNYLLFKDWHQISCHRLGEKVLSRVYQVCFNVSWEVIGQIIALNQEKEIYWWQVLAIQPSANSLEVEKAYKKLMSYWHPDVNRSSHAHQISTMINLAYQQYCTLPKPRPVDVHISSFIKKILSFFSFLKPLGLQKLRN